MSNLNEAHELGTGESEESQTTDIIGERINEGLPSTSQSTTTEALDEILHVETCFDGAVESKVEFFAEIREGPTRESLPADWAASSSHLEVIESGASAHFARLVRGWEKYVDHGSRQVQQRLQNLNICGDGSLVRIAGASPDDHDLFNPIVLRHTHSSPLNYTSMFDEDPPPPAQLEHMRRSSSTPSTSAFRQRSAGSAFGTNLRTMPHLTGPDNRSAFSLPMHRHWSSNDSEGRYSAFDAVSYHFDVAETEKTSIEVMDIGMGRREEETQQKWPAASKARKFLKENVLARRRRRRGGRENPARPASNESSPKTDDERSREVYEAGVPSGSASRGPEVAVVVSTNMEETGSLTQEPYSSHCPVDEGDSIVAATSARNASHDGEHQYHQLDSDLDEGEDHYQRIETVHESPENVPTPSYQLLEDGEPPPAAAVSIQISARSPSPQHPSVKNIGSPPPSLLGRSLSQDSGADSPGTAMSALTSNTSGHSTLGTSTSGTSSSGRTILSVVSETDREVMETNKTARSFQIRQCLQARPKHDGDATVHSSSTTSTTTHGYLALTNSPDPLREGASLPSDRFFKASQIPMSYSASSNSNASSSSSSGGAALSTVESGHGAGIAREESQLTTSTVNPFTPNDSENTSSSSSGDAPPKFVSYLDRQVSLQSVDTAKTTAHANTRSSPPLLMKGDSMEERESPAQIVGYSEVVFEAAKPEAEKLFRPVKQRDPRFASRPPLSPTKGLRAMVTPPPCHHQCPDSPSPAYQQLSPPNIVDHHIERSEVLSKPYVLRSNRPGMVLVAPDRPFNAAFPEKPSQRLQQVELGRSGTYREYSIEVETTEPAIVSPDKTTAG